jgi:pimeloyl-ACP methyl ester carboxylesterase
MNHLTRDGIELAYDDTGSGGRPLVFSHGFGGDASHFAPLIEQLRKRHRCIAVDRRGHGRSSKPEGPYDVPTFADDLAWLVRELGVDKPVVVAHSMGAIALDLALRHKELLAGVIVIDAPAFAPPEVIEGFRGLAAALRTPHYQAAILGMADQAIWAATDERDVRDRTMDAMLATPQHVLAASWEQFLAYDPVPAARALRLPLLYIHANMPADLARLQATVPHAWIGQTVGSGHFPQLIVPDQVTAMITRWLAVHFR